MSKPWKTGGDIGKCINKFKIFIVLLNVVLIVSIFNFTRANTKDNTRNALIIDVSELISLLVVVLLCVNKILNNIMTEF